MRGWFAVGFILYLLFSAALPPLPSAAQVFDRRAMLENLVQQIILPAHQNMAMQAVALESAIKAFAAAPTPESLEAAQGAWRAAVRAWQPCAVFAVRAVERLHTPISKAPPNPRLIEGFINSEQVIDEAFIESIGSTSKGLPALEYLLFAREGTEASHWDALIRNPRRIVYVVALGENLRRKTAELLNVWQERYADAFINADADGGDLQGSVSMLLNQLVITLEDVIMRRIDMPLYRAIPNSTRPELSESPLAGYSLQSILITISAVQDTFNGADGLGFDDYLNTLGVRRDDQLLADLINAQFEVAQESLRALLPPSAGFGDALGESAPPYDAFAHALRTDPSRIVEARQAVHGVLRLIKADVANNLGVTITFSDGDGD